MPKRASQEGANIGIDSVADIRPPTTTTEKNSEVGKSTSEVEKTISEVGETV